MAQLSVHASDGREAGKFLKSPLGHYLAFRAYGGTLGDDTPLRLRLGALYHKQEREFEYAKAMISASRPLKTEGKHRVKALAIPWAAPAVSPNEESAEVLNSGLMGSVLVLDEKQCPFITAEKRKKAKVENVIEAIEKRRKHKPRRMKNNG